MSLFERVFELYPQPVFVFDFGSGMINRANPSAVRTLQLGAKAILKMRIWDLFSSSDVPAVRKAVKAGCLHRKDRASAAFMEHVWRLERMDGTVLPVKLTAGSAGGKFVVLCAEAAGLSPEERSSVREIAFQELLQQMEHQGETIRRELRRRIEKFVLPGLKKLKGRVARKEDRRYFDAIESHLEEALRNGPTDAADKLMHLSVRESEVCSLIRYGMSSKEIAETLNVSPTTVETQRNRIRKKLGLTNKGINLVSYLQRMEG